jgi:flagellum-specific ATP synthase
VFAELPQLLERAGPGTGTGMITGLFTVLVEGDDTNEPVADAVRGILDGHVVLDRAVAESGRFPAIDVLRSISRMAPACYTPDERELVGEARRLLRAHADMAELIRLGAYRSRNQAFLSLFRIDGRAHTNALTSPKTVNIYWAVSSLAMQANTICFTKW